jgi:hypothetical protein
MARASRLLCHLVQFLCLLLTLLGDAVRLPLLCLRSSVALTAENLFLREESLDFKIPPTQDHLRQLRQEWVPYYAA